MHIMPTTKQEWSKLTLFPFKAYTVVAFPCFQLLDHDDWLFKYSHTGNYILIGYLLTGAVLVVAGLVQKHVFKSQSAESSIGFGIAAILIGFVIMPMFAPA